MSSAFLDKASNPGRIIHAGDVGDQATLRAGAKCDALYRYYFHGTASDEISEFISRDKQFVEKYGYSVIDAIYVENVQFYSMNGDVGEFSLKYAKGLVRKGLYTIKENVSEFNGKPSVAFSGERTPAGDEFRNRVFQ